MHRVSIRNTTSKSNRRLFDIVFDDANNAMMEIQSPKGGKEIVPLSVVLLQIMQATQMSDCSHSKSNVRSA